jgi:hypothetical protein
MAAMVDELEDNKGCCGALREFKESLVRSADTSYQIRHSYFKLFLRFVSGISNRDPMWPAKHHLPQQGPDPCGAGNWLRSTGL